MFNSMEENSPCLLEFGTKERREMVIFIGHGFLAAFMFASVEVTSHFLSVKALRFLR